MSNRESLWSLLNFSPLIGFRRPFEICLRSFPSPASSHDLFCCRSAHTHGHGPCFVHCCLVISRSPDTPLASSQSIRSPACVKAKRAVSLLGLFPKYLCPFLSCSCQGGILCDEMGLGKTAATLVLHMVNPPKTPSENVPLDEAEWGPISGKQARVSRCLVLMWNTFAALACDGGEKAVRKRRHVPV